MKRIIFDVPRWHAYLHRDARGLEIAKDKDDPVRKFEDELFDRLYSGESERLPERQQDAKLRTWAAGVHSALEQLPAFTRVAQECRGEPMAAGIAVESLMAELKPQQPAEPAGPPPENIRRKIGSGCEKASQAIDEMRDALEGLAEIGFNSIPGTGTGFGGEMPATSIRALATRLRSDARLRQIALLAGRFKRIAASKRRSRVRHGSDEIVDIEQGAELARILPSELVKLTHRTVRAAFMRSLIEREAVQYQLVGNEPLGKGPLVVLVDKSGSMDGPRDVWATALALALLEAARRDRRMFAILAFDSRVKFEAIVKPDEPLPEAALFTACAGGTEIGVAMHRGLEIIRSNEGRLKKADVVLVTDGGSDTASAPALREAARLIGVTTIGIGIGVERDWLLPWCDEVQVIQDLTKIDDSSAEMLFAA